MGIQVNTQDGDSGKHEQGELGSWDAAIHEKGSGCLALWGPGQPASSSGFFPVHLCTRPEAAIRKAYLKGLCGEVGGQTHPANETRADSMQERRGWGC